MFVIKPSPADPKIRYIYQAKNVKELPAFPFAYINVEGIIWFMVERVPMTVNELKELVVDIQMDSIKDIERVKEVKRVEGEEEDD